MFDAGVKPGGEEDFDPSPPSLDTVTRAAPAEAADVPEPLAAVTQFTSHLRLFGLDLVQPFAVGWYNQAVEPALRLPDLGSGDSLGLLIGNTRALWPVFIDALRDDPALLQARNPVETYVVRVIEAGQRALALRSEMRWAHSVGREMVAVQRLAELSGLAALAPANLSVHPHFGPWIALRAVAVLDLPGPPGPPAPAVLACADCERACLPAFRRARSGWLGSAASDNGWRLWLAVRDSCPLGREHRYDDDQIVYHYTKDPAVLRAAVRALD